MQHSRRPETDQVDAFEQPVGCFAPSGFQRGVLLGGAKLRQKPTLTTESYLQAHAESAAYQSTLDKVSLRTPLAGEE